MRSSTTRRFREAFADLPKSVQRQTREAYARFRGSPDHPSLRFKKVHASEPIWSVRISIDYRAVGYRDQDQIIWFWVGSHAQYEKLLKDL